MTDKIKAVNREHVALAAMSVEDARNMLLHGGELFQQRWTDGHR